MTEAINAVTTLEGQKISYRIVQSRRARRLRITVSGSGVTVTLPVGVKVVEAERMLQQNSRWLLAQLERVSKKSAQGNVLPKDVVLLRGRPRRIEIVEDSERISRIHVSEEKEKLVVRVPAGNGKSPRALVEPWLKQQARKEIEAMVNNHAQRMNLRVKSISIRDQRTRWGSCSSKGALSFNWRLVMAPSEVLEYVVVHELAHMRQPNHTPAFWKVVAQYMPDFKNRRAWLRKNAASLRPVD